jgi:hypothetical protein
MARPALVASRRGSAQGGCKPPERQGPDAAQVPKTAGMFCRGQTAALSLLSLMHTVGAAPAQGALPAGADPGQGASAPAEGAAGGGRRMRAGDLRNSTARCKGDIFPY